MDPDAFGRRQAGRGAAIAPEPGQLAELRRRIQFYLGWERSAGSRTLAAGVVEYLQENVLAANNRQLAL